MNKTFTLYRVLRKCGSGAGDKSDGTSGAFDPEKLLLILCGVLFAALFGYGGYKIVPHVSAFGGIDRILAAFGVVFSVLLLFISFKSLLSSMYLSSDVDVLITMPLTPNQIVINRVLGSLTDALEVCGATFLPFTVGYCIGGSFGFRMALSWILSAVTIPLFTVLVTATVLMLLLRVVRVFRSKEVLALIGVLVALLLTVGRLGFNRGAEFATEQFLIGAVDVLSGFAPYVPTVWFLSQFCAGGSVLYLLYTAAVLAAAAVLFRIVAGTCYLGGALNMLNASSSPRAMTEKRMRKLTKKRTVLASLRCRDFRTSRRTPAFLLNNYLLLWGWPVIAAVVVLLRNISASDFVGEMAEQTAEQTAAVGFGLILLIVPTVLPLFGLLSQIASRAFSREGADLQNLRQLPVTSRDLIRAKRGLALRVMGIATVVFPGLIFLYLALLKNVSPLGCLFGFLICIPVTFSTVQFGILFDLRRPNLNWMNEADVGKGNIAYILFTVVLVLINLVIGVVSVVCTVVFLSSAARLVIGTVVLVLQTVTALISGKLMFSRGIKALKRLSVG